jgi:hypothetical protein
VPDLGFQVVGAEAGSRGMTPLLYFRLRVTNTPASERVQAVLLRTQIQFECARRPYESSEREKLGEIFGTPDRWGQTLRNKLWAHVDVSVPAFTGSTEVLLPVPCTYDLNILSAKYLDALEAGDVALLFLFSGTIFYPNREGLLQVQQISWEKECSYEMPAATWRGLMEKFYPKTAWMYLHRDIFDKIYSYRRRHGLPSWETTVTKLLASEGVEENSLT